MKKTDFKAFLSLVTSVGLLAIFMILACMNEKRMIWGVSVLFILIFLYFVVLSWKNIKSWKEEFEGLINELKLKTEKSQLEVEVNACIASLRERSADFKREKIELDRRLDDCAASVNDVSIENDKLKKEMSELNKKIDNRVSLIQTDFSEKFANLSWETTELNGKITDCVASVHEVSDQIIAFTDEKSKVDHEIADYVSSLKAITDEKASFEKSITEFEENAARRFMILESSLLEISAKNAELEKKVTKLEEELNKSKNQASIAEWSAPEAGTRRVIEYKGVEFAFRYCPAGSFTMGEGQTAHKVTLTHGFWVQETELTQEQWNVLGVRKEKKCSFIGQNLPVETTSWNECNDYISKLNSLDLVPNGMKFALPTEAQWEYACRAGTKTAYSWGNILNGDKANCNGNYPYGTMTKGKYLAGTTLVGSYDSNPWGVYDMHGNVWEWCSDMYGIYPGGDVVDPTGIGDSDVPSRVCRGGSWFGNATCCRASYRHYHDPAFCDNSLGFRLLLERSDQER